MDELIETRGTSQRLASLEHDARQSRLAMETDVQADTKTCELMEGVPTAVQAMYGDSCSAKRVDPDPVLPASVVTPPDLRLSPVQGMMPS